MKAILTGVGVLALVGAVVGCSDTATLGEQVVNSAANQAAATARANGATSAHGDPFAALTDEQRAALEALHEQLVAGEIDETTFAQRFEEITGFAPPPKRRPPLEMLANLLSLTDEQKAAAQTIFDELHAALTTLHDETHAAIRALLTEEQQAKFDEMTPAGAPAGPGGALGGHRGSGGKHGFGPPPGAPRMGGHDAQFDRLADELGLSDEQRTQVAAVHEQARAQAQTLHENARTAFRALLNEEQLAKLDEFEASHPRPEHGG